MEKKLRVAVIGVGGIAQNQHLPAYEKIDNVDVVAVCDINEPRVKMVAEKFNVPKACTDYKEILEMDNLDAIDICTPNYLHSVIACAALEKGLHVLCEKPDAVSVAEAEKMKAAAEKSGKCLMVIRNNRYWPTSGFLKKFIGDGKMGEIYAARCGWQRRRGIPGRGGWFTTKAQSGGGPLIDLGVHMIDLALWLMGNPTPVAAAHTTNSLIPMTSVILLNQGMATEIKTAYLMLRTWQWDLLNLTTVLACRLNFPGRRISKRKISLLSSEAKRQARRGAV